MFLASLMGFKDSVMSTPEAKLNHKDIFKELIDLKKACGKLAPLFNSFYIQGNRLHFKPYTVFVKVHWKLILAMVFGTSLFHHDMIKYFICVFKVYNIFLFISFVEVPFHWSLRMIFGYRYNKWETWSASEKEQLSIKFIKIAYLLSLRKLVLI